MGEATAVNEQLWQQIGELRSRIARMRLEVGEIQNESEGIESACDGYM